MAAGEGRFWLAEWESRSFSWRGVGRTKEEAWLALRGAWLAHVAALHARGEMVDEAYLERDDVEVVEIVAGEGCRDGMVLFRG